MIRLICGLILVLVLATPSWAQQSLVGTYKLVSLVVEVDGTPTQTMGKAPPWLPRDNANPLPHFHYSRQQKIRHFCG